MSAKKTPWFLAGVKPVRVGAYEVYREGLVAGYPQQSRLHWDGADWRHTNHSCPGYQGHFASMGSRDKWRGLASDPSKKPKRK